MTRSSVRCCIGLAIVAAHAATTGSAHAQTYTPSGWTTSPTITQNAPTNTVDTADDFLFTLAPSGHKAAISLADPTIVWAKAPGASEGWYYITGTGGGGTTGNFMIYKSKDLRTFTAHKFAFAQSTQSGRVNQIGGGTYVYGNMYTPQLFIDPSDPNTVHIAFEAVVGALPTPTTARTYANIIKVPHWKKSFSGNPALNVNPLYPWDQDHQNWQDYYAAGFDPANYWTTEAGAVAAPWDAQHVDCLFQVSRYSSCYVASMPLSDFADTDTAKTFEAAGRNVRWFSYVGSDSTLKYDGGQSLTTPQLVPTSEFAYGIGAQLRQSTWWYQSGAYQASEATESLYAPFGMAHRTGTGALWSGATFMMSTCSMFYDPLDSNVPWVLYGWRDIGASNSLNYRGEHTAMARITEGTDWLLKTGAAYGAKPLNFCVNSTAAHQITAQIGGATVLNGQYDNSGMASAPGWRIGESQSAFYDESRTCYYEFFSRNTWDSPAYCVNYRYMDVDLTHPNFTSFASPGGWIDPNVSEEMLVSNKQYVGTSVVDNRRWVNNRNYGTGRMFYYRRANGDFALDAYGHKVPYLIFSVKFDNSSFRTVLFKRMHWLDDSNTSSLPFKEFVELHTDPARNTWLSEFPNN